MFKRRIILLSCNSKVSPSIILFIVTVSLCGERFVFIKKKFIAISKIISKANKKEYFLSIFKIP